jgi:hypothetical protein
VIRFHFILLVLLGVGHLSAIAQKNASCPLISVIGPPNITPPGKTAPYTAVVPDGLSGLTYQWSLSEGKIKSGQGRPVLEVVQPNACLIVKVEIGGLPSSCPHVFSVASCFDAAPSLEKLGTISGVLNNKKLAIIKDVKEKYSGSPHSQFYLVVSGTRQPITRTRKLTRLKQLFVNDVGRISFVVSEKPDDKVILWAVPPGANPPEP